MRDGGNVAIERFRAQSFEPGEEIGIAQQAIFDDFRITAQQLAPGKRRQNTRVRNHQAGLVESRKEGRWIYYRLPHNGAEPSVREAIRWLERSIADEPRIVEDGQRLKKILKIDPVELCKRQCGK